MPDMVYTSRGFETKASQYGYNDEAKTSSHVTNFNHQAEEVSDSSCEDEAENSKQVINYNDTKVSDSSIEAEASPELLPKRRPKINSSNKEDSLIFMKGKKRIMRIDSDTDNSLIIEHNKHDKLKCVKDTPIRINLGSAARTVNNSLTLIDSDRDDSDSDDKRDHHLSDSDSCDEVERVMSKETRKSIMGIMPKTIHDSDESDAIQTDESNLPSRSSSTTNLTKSRNSPTDFPPVTIIGRKTLEIPTADRYESHSSDNENETNTSPLKDISHSQDKTVDYEKHTRKSSSVGKVDEDLKKNVMTNLMMGDKENMDHSYGVTVVENPPEVIALSSDDEEHIVNSLQTRKSLDYPQSARLKKSPEDNVTKRKSSKSSDNIKQYLVPPSYPNSGIKYVSQKVRDEALRELNNLRREKADLEAIFKSSKIQMLPDNGMKIIKRLSMLTEQLRIKEELVSNMVVSPEEKKIDNTLSWEVIQKGSNAVQPVGNQGFATHMIERGMILERLRQLHASFDSRPPDTEEARPPRGLVSTLMTHQLKALAWLKWRETQKPRAGILADDMGLGKTLTMIALVLSDKEDTIDNDEEDTDGEGSKLSRGGTLVVCPASLAQQWAGEIKRHCKSGALSVCLHHGAVRARNHQRLLPHDIVITTYNILQRDYEKKGVLLRVRWRRVILDEAHVVRNHKTATCAGACAARAPRRWCLTGTPVHNKNLDMFALFRFMKLTPFDEIKMWKKWIDNKTVGGQERLSTIIRCLVLRRTKAQLKDEGDLKGLPERKHHHRWLPLTEAELHVYQKVLAFSKKLFGQFLQQRAESQADAGRATAYDEMHKKMIALKGVKVKSHQILVLLLRLRQICCHCGLIGAMLSDEDQEDIECDEGSQVLLDALRKLSIGPRFNGNNDVEDETPDEVHQGRDEGATVSEALRSVLSSSNPVFNLEKPSSKIKAVIECLQNDVFIHKGDKAVVVSQWTSVLQLVKRELDGRGVPTVLFTGRVAVDQRAKLVAQFNDPRSDIKVMLLSLCAGGVGLNLCGANHLLLVDPHWNPQLEEQAQDRIYRVGQNRPVHIYKFLCEETVEQNIKKLQDNKLEMAENVLTGATNASKLTINDLKMLFHMTE